MLWAPSTLTLYVNINSSGLVSRMVLPRAMPALLIYSQEARALSDPFFSLRAAVVLTMIVGCPIW